MKMLPLIIAVLLIFTGCESSTNGDYRSPSPKEFAKDHPGAFDTIIGEDGDTVLICNMPIDSIV